MSKFEIRKGIDSALNSNGKKLLDIRFVGIGGAFDTDEGNASVWLQTRAGKHFLIDCSHSTYSNLRKWNLVDTVDRVFITHTHEDHISGLSTLVYERFFIHKQTTLIECHENVAPKVKQYLDVCGHPEEQYTINTGNLFIEDEKISITKIDTTEHHWPVNNFPNSALLFHFDTGDDYAVFIYSGDINKPITSLMDPESYSFVFEKPENVFIFHDMTDLVHEQNPHCNFELLKPVKEKFSNLFTYHHSGPQIENINNLGHPHIALTSLIIQGNNFVIEEKMGI